MRIAMFKGDSRYEAANSFVDALADAFTALGAKPMVVDIRGGQADLGDQLSAVCDADDLIALVGVNGLGSAVKVDGMALHQALGVPFVSYLTEHPLFHADRLSRLHDQPMLCVDAAHVRFLQGFGMPQAYLALHGASTPPDYYSAPRWVDRPGRVLFAGSFEPLDAARARLSALVAHDRAAVDAGIPALGGAFDALADEGPFLTDQALLDRAAVHPLTFSVQQFLGISAHYTCLLQCLIQWHSLKLRHTVLTQLDQAGVAVDLVGDGWDEAGFTRHRPLGPRAFPDLHRLLPSYRFVLNISPLLGEGLHDRVTYGALAGAVVCTDHNPQSAALIDPGGALGYPAGLTGGADGAGLAAAIDRLDKTPEGATMAALGREITMFSHAWSLRARQIMGVLGR